MSSVVTTLAVIALTALGGWGLVLVTGPTPWWLSWVTAVGTILGIYLIRTLRWSGFVVSLVNQVPWWAITIGQENWGFVPINLFLTWNYLRGIVEWRARRLQ